MPCGTDAAASHRLAENHVIVLVLPEDDHASEGVGADGLLLLLCRSFVLLPWRLMGVGD